MNLITHVSSLISVSKDLEAELNTISETIVVEKNTTLINLNERCDTLYFVDKGLLRGYYFNEDKEITNWFAQESEFGTCFYSFFTNQNSHEIIQTLEDSKLTKVSHQSLQKLYIKFPETERAGRLITLDYYIKLEERLLNIQFKNAKERYNKFLSEKSSLLQRASLGQIASYLGITQETLSRIRAEL